MGNKGDKNTSASEGMAAMLLDRLTYVNELKIKKMFGGHGVFSEGKMFGMVDSKGMLFLKVDDELRSEFLSEGGQKHGKMPYVSVPDEIVDSEKLLKWVSSAISVAQD